MRANRVVAQLLAGGRWRRTAAILTITVVGLVGYEKVAVEFMHDRRQDALVSQFTNAPTSSELSFGDAVAVLQIPQISLNTVVSEGESHATMRAGPAHRASSVMPGAFGNAVIAGKAVRYGAPFGRLHELAVGSEIYVKLRASGPVRFVVDSVETLSRDDESPFAPTDDATLTLVTSATRFGGDALVVHAVADAATAVNDEPARALAPASNDAVSFTDLAVGAIWLGAFVGLCWVLAHAPLRLRNGVRVVIFGPTIGFAALQFALALERLLPATV